MNLQLGKWENSWNNWTMNLSIRSSINKFYARPGDWSVLGSGRWGRQQNLLSGVYLVNLTLPCSNEGYSVLFFIWSRNAITNIINIGQWSVWWYVVIVDPNINSEGYQIFFALSSASVLVMTFDRNLLGLIVDTAIQDIGTSNTNPPSSLQSVVLNYSCYCGVRSK